VNRFGRTTSYQPEPQTIRPPRTALGNELRKIFSPPKVDWHIDYAELETRLVEIEKDNKMTDEEFTDCLNAIRKCADDFISGARNDTRPTEVIWDRIEKAGRLREASDIFTAEAMKEFEACK
jgi:hypothetical protein